MENNYETLEKNSFFQEEKENKIIQLNRVGQNILTVENDKNIISENIKKSEELKDEDLFNGYLNKLERDINENFFEPELIKSIINGKKEYNELYNYLKNEKELIKNKEFINEIKKDNIIKNQLYNFCKYFLNEYSNIAIIKGNYPEKKEFLSQLYIKEKLEELSNEIFKENWNLEILESEEIIKLDKNIKIEDIMKELYPQDEIDMKELKDDFEKNNYSKKYINFYQFILEIFGNENDNSNVIIKKEGLFEIFSSEENLKKEFKDYLKTKIILKKVEENKVNILKSILEKYNILLNENKENKINILKSNIEKFKVLLNRKEEEIVNLFKALEFCKNLKKDYKKIKLIEKNKELKQEIIEILTLNNSFVIQMNDDYIYFYDSQTYQLINKLKLNITGKIFLLNKKDIIFKNNEVNYITKINTKKFEISEINLAYSKTLDIIFVTLNQHILMNNEENKTDIFIYSKINNIYKLIKILKIEFNYIYQFNLNSLILASGPEVYLYSTDNFELIKYRKAFIFSDYIKLCDISDKYMIGYSCKQQYNSYTRTYINLIDKNTFKNDFEFLDMFDIKSIKLNKNKKGNLLGFSYELGIFVIQIINEALFVQEFLNIEDVKNENIHECYQLNNGNILIETDEGLFYLV